DVSCEDHSMVLVTTIILASNSVSSALCSARTQIRRKIAPERGAAFDVQGEQDGAEPSSSELPGLAQTDKLLSTLAFGVKARTTTAVWADAFHRFHPRERSQRQNSGSLESVGSRPKLLAPAIELSRALRKPARENTDLAGTAR